MRKCDWCEKNSSCYGARRSECIVRDYKDFIRAYSLCDSCLHEKVCRFEVGSGQSCADYIKR